MAPRVASWCGPRRCGFGSPEAGGTGAWSSLRPGAPGLRPCSSGLRLCPSSRRGLSRECVVTTPLGRAGGRRGEPSPELGLSCSGPALAGSAARPSCGRRLPGCGVRGLGDPGRGWLRGLWGGLRCCGRGRGPVLLWAERERRRSGSAGFRPSSCSPRSPASLVTGSPPAEVGPSLCR